MPPVGLTGGKLEATGDYVTAPRLDGLETLSYPINVSGGVTSVPMLGNGPDSTLTANGGVPVHCCCEAALIHGRIIKAANAGVPYTPPTSNQVVTPYLAADGGKDNGSVVANVFAAQLAAGGVLGYARIDHTNRQLCDSSMLTYHGLYCGGNLTSDADSIYLAGGTWTVAAGQAPDVTQSHCFIRMGADGSTSTNMSWAAPVKSTFAWDAICINETWVFISPEDNLSGAALDAAKTALVALGGVV